MKPFLEDPDLTLYQGDVLDVLATLEDGSVDCCITSPPYWGLRDYSAPGQIGLEPDPATYIARMAEVFLEVRRVLAGHGTCWVNIGDSYANDTKWGGTTGGKHAAGLHAAGGLGRGKQTTGLKQKDLCGIPWMLAFALRDEGWYLRSDIVWSKPNQMPESVTDRPTKSHEHIFLLSKGPRYFFDQEAVREPHHPDERSVTKVVGQDGSIQHRDGERWPNAGRNIRDVWEIATQPYSEAHFATFPEELVRRCLLAGCPEWVCGVCGRPRERIVEREQPPEPEHRNPEKRLEPGQAGNVGAGNMGFRASRLSGQEMNRWRAENPGVEAWSDCGHDNYRPGRVLDPFFGSGTTGLVARKHGRHTVGIELNPEYCALAARRLQQLSLLAEGA